MINVIYGAGDYGQTLLRILSMLNIEVTFFAQTKISDLDSVEGIPLISLDNLLEMTDDVINILFAINNIELFYELESTLHEKNVDAVRLINCIDFVSNNPYIANKRIVGGSKKCLACGSEIQSFLPGGIENDFLKKHTVIGAGFRKNYSCPVCKSFDRERWLYYLLENELNISKMKGKILHFAPEKNISYLIKRNPDIDYYTGDIAKGKAKHITDITDIQYANASMDYVICNHVLEHIPDVDQAIAEIKRVLKDSGKFIFSFPVNMDDNTFEDQEIKTPADRLKYYGQEDHVRIYGRDFEDIYKNYGFDLKIYSPKMMLKDDEIEQLGLSADDILVVGTKKKGYMYWG